MKTKYSIPLSIVFFELVYPFLLLFFFGSFSLWKIIMKIIIDMSLSNNLNFNHTIPICIQNMLCEYFQSGKCIFPYEFQQQTHTQRDAHMSAVLTHAIFYFGSIQCYTRKKSFVFDSTTEE